MDTSDSSVTPPRPRRSGRARSESATVSFSNRPSAGTRRKHVTLLLTVQDIPEGEDFSDEELGVNLEDSPGRIHAVRTVIDDVPSALAVRDPSPLPSSQSSVRVALAPAHIPVPTTPFSPQRIPPPDASAVSLPPPTSTSLTGLPSLGSWPLSHGKASRRRAAKQPAPPATLLVPQLSPGTAEDYMRSGSFQGPHLMQPLHSLSLSTLPPVITDASMLQVPSSFAPSSTHDAFTDTSTTLQIPLHAMPLLRSSSSHGGSTMGNAGDQPTGDDITISRAELLSLLQRFGSGIAHALPSSNGSALGSIRDHTPSALLLPAINITPATPALGDAQTS